MDMKWFVCAAAVAGAAGAAVAQPCNIRRDLVPDLDQRRSALPNNGSMFCVPASGLNWMAYLANRGFPVLMNQNGRRDYQSSAMYNVVSARMLEMGLLMGTSPTGGTTSGNGRDGLVRYMAVRGIPYFTVSSYTGEISPIGIYLHMLGGGLVNICYGRYSPNSVGWYSRNGGHCVTVTGVFNACGIVPRIRYNDPASDENLTWQSDFTSALSSAERITMPTSPFTSKTRWQLTDINPGQTTRRCIDSCIVIRPLIALTAAAYRSGELVTLRPVSLPGLYLPPQTSATVPDGGEITGVTLMPDGLEAVVTTNSPGPTPLKKLWRYMIPTGEFTQVLLCGDMSAAATSRFKDVYLWCDGALRRMELHEGGDASTHQEVRSPYPMQALAYDDARDELVGLSGTDMRLVRLSRMLDVVADSALPAVQLTGKVSLAIDETAQRYFIAASGGHTIFELAAGEGGPMQLVSEITLPAVQHPAGLQFTDHGTLVVVHAGGISEFRRTTAGGWEPEEASPLAGLGGHGVLAVARSRTDFLPGVHDTPEWDNVLVDEQVEERPECRTDWDFTLSVNSADISTFLARWIESLQGDTTVADFDEDGTVNSADISAFLAAWLEDVSRDCW